MSESGVHKQVILALYSHILVFASWSMNLWESLFAPVVQFVSSYSPFFGDSVEEVVESTYYVALAVGPIVLILLAQLVIGTVEFQIIDRGLQLPLDAYVSAAVVGAGIWSFWQARTASKNATRIAVVVILAGVSVPVLPASFVLSTVVAAVYTVGIVSPTLFESKYCITRAKTAPENILAEENPQLDQFYDEGRFILYTIAVSVGMIGLSAYAAFTNTYLAVISISVYIGSYLISRRLYDDIERTLPYIDTPVTGVKWIFLSRSVPLFGALLYAGSSPLTVGYLLPAFGSVVSAALFAGFMVRIDEFHGEIREYDYTIKEEKNQSVITNLDIDISHEDKQMQHGDQEMWHGTLRVGADIDVGVEADQSTDVLTYLRALKKFVLLKHMVRGLTSKGDPSREKLNWTVNAMAARLPDTIEFQDEYMGEDIPAYLQEEIQNAQKRDVATSDGLIRYNQDSVDLGDYE